MIYDRELAAGSVVNQPHYKIAHLDTGRVSALKVGSGGDFLGPVFAAFSPDGSRVAYLYHDGASSDAPLVVAVRPSGGGDEQTISHDVFGEAGYPPTPHRLMQVEVDLQAVWTDDDRLVFPTAGWALVLDLEGLDPRRQDENGETGPFGRRFHPPLPYRGIAGRRRAQDPREHAGL